MQLALNPSQPPMQWFGEAALCGVKRLVREADRSPPSSTAAENDWIFSFIPPIYLHVVYKEDFCHSALWWGVVMAVHWNMMGWACGIVAVCVSDNRMTTLHYHPVFIYFCVFLSCQCQMWACNTKVCTELLLLASILPTLLSPRSDTDWLFL